MIYFLVTTSIFNNCEIRKNQYINGINTLKNVLINNKMTNYEIIIIENNGLRPTYLDVLDCKVYYTWNNFLAIDNKGSKELQDILDCIKEYNITDADFIVKMTGRYIIENNSEFINVVKNLNNTNYDCVIKYGSFYSPVNYKIKDCITGLIGMRCKYVKQIIKPAKPDTQESVEQNWAAITYLIDDSLIYKVNKLGIYICPGSNKYFYV